MKKIIPQIAVATSILLFAGSVFAKPLPRYSPSKKSVAPAKPVSATSYVSVKLRADRKALLVSFMNLQNVRSLSYTLTYNGNGADQGVTGSVDLSAGNSVSRELVFGTESKGVYTYHNNIKDMRFVVTIVLKTGKTVMKKYIVKV